MPNKVKKLELFEFSGVDRPAQEPALVAAIKNKKGRKDKPAFTLKLADLLTDVVQGHQHSLNVHVYGDGELDIWVSHSTAQGASEAHTHPVGVDENGDLVIGMSAGHFHAVPMADVQSAIFRALAAKIAPSQSSPSNKGESEDCVMDDAIRDALVKSLTSAHKQAYDALPAEKRDEFLGLAGDEREAMVAEAAAKAAESDPVVYTTTEGVEIRKSQGDAVKALAEKADETAKALEAEKAKTRDVEITKRAEALKLGGDLDARKAVVSALDAIEDEALREKAFKTVATGDAAVAALGNSIGTSEAPGEFGDLTPTEASKKLKELEDEAAKADPNASRSEIIKRVQNENAGLVRKARS